jgi:hypothetical protein
MHTLLLLLLLHGVPHEGEVKYGPRAGYCWNGDPSRPNAYSRLPYNTMYVPQIMERIANTAPPGADMSWRYWSPALPPTNLMVTSHIDRFNANHGLAPFVAHLAVDVLSPIAISSRYLPLRASNGEV